MAQRVIGCQIRDVAEVLDRLRRSARREQEVAHLEVAPPETRLNPNGSLKGSLRLIEAVLPLVRPGEARVGIHRVGIQRDRALEVPLCLVILAGIPIEIAERRVDVAGGTVERQSPMAGALCPLEQTRRAHPFVTEQIGIAQACISLCVVDVDRDRLLEQRLRTLEGELAFGAAQITPPLQVVLVGFEARRRLPVEPGVRVARKHDLQRLGHLAGDVGLNAEDILDLAVVGFRPYVKAGVGLDQLCGHPDPPPLPADASFEHMAHAQVESDRGNVDVFVLEVERRRPSSDPEFLQPAERVENFLRQPIAEVLISRVVAHVQEWEDGDGSCLFNIRSDRARVAGCHFSSGRRRFGSVEPVLPEREKSDHPDQRRDDDVIDPALSQCALETGRRLVDYHTLGCDLERPRKDQRNGKTDDHQHHDQGLAPRRDEQCREDGFGDLDDQPCAHHVHESDAKYPAPLQIGEDAFEAPGRHVVGLRPWR